MKKLPTIKKLLETQKWPPEPKKDISPKVGPRTKPLSSQMPTGKHPVNMYSMSAPDAYKLIQKFAGRLDQAGIHVGESPSKLGSGATGTAFDLRDGTALKVTVDRNEANACQRIKGKKLKNVYQIFNVFELDSLNTYVIHQELLEPLDPVVRKYWSAVNSALGKWKYDGHTSDDNKALEYFEYYWDQSNSEFDKQPHDQLQTAFLEILNGMRELDEHKIEFIDYHVGNIMFRAHTGQHVIIDLGVSKSPEQKINKLEEVALKSLFNHQMARIIK